MTKQQWIERALIALGVALILGATIAYAPANETRPIPQCTTDTDCMLKFGGDGGPDPAKEQR